MRVVRTGTGPPPCAKSPGRLESWSNARGKCGTGSQYLAVIRRLLAEEKARKHCCRLFFASVGFLVADCLDTTQKTKQSCNNDRLLTHHLMCTHASHTPPPALNPQPLTTQHLVFGREISDSLLDFLLDFNDQGVCFYPAPCYMSDGASLTPASQTRPCLTAALHSRLRMTRTPDAHLWPRRPRSR